MAGLFSDDVLSHFTWKKWVREYVIHKQTDNDGMKQHMLLLKNRTESAAATTADLAEVD